MKKCFIGMFLMLLSGGIWWSEGSKLAESATAGPQIIIAQIKITSSSGQFITLYNNSNNSIDLSTIQLQYYNNYDLLKATSGKLISLTGKVPAHGFVVVDDGPIQACYQMTVNSVSLGLSSTAGFIQVAHFLGTTSPQVVSILDDYVGWSKTAAPGAQTLPVSTSAFLQRKATDGSLNYGSIIQPSAGSWIGVNQPDGSTPCDSSTASVASGGASLSSSSSPIPFSTASTTSPNAGNSIPDVDAGLAAPQISEILPNPAEPQTDADNEFIELYNSNERPFDLSGFIIQSGTTTVHKYTFPSGTTIGAHQFAAYFSSETGLSLSNTSGQVKLLDPGGNVLGQTDIYGTAKDGYTWIFADGLWQWTTSSTPGAANIIATPPVVAAASVTKTKTAKASTKKSTKTKTAAAVAATSNLPPSAKPASRLHPAILAGVGAIAVIYALYEYRNDLANQYYKLRRHRASRRVAG